MPAAHTVQIAERHPARIILLNYVPTTGQRGSLGEASVGVLVYGAATGRYGVEVIAVEATCAAPNVPSIVRHLTRGDVPTTVWWTPDLSLIRPPDALVQTGRQFLFDSGTWLDAPQGAKAAASLLTLSPSPDVADLNWRRLAPLRSTIVQTLRHEPKGVGPVTAVTVRHLPTEGAAAGLIAAWIKNGVGVMPVAIEAMTGVGDELLHITLEASGWRMTAALHPQRVVVENNGRPPISMPVPALVTADAVIAELRELGRDQQLRRAIEIASQLLTKPASA
jgi:glucose-6-phosphate dehydrogenase assembly protein OpcA